MSLGENGYVILKGIFDSVELQPVLDLSKKIIAYAENHTHDPFENYFLAHRPDKGILYDLYQRHPEFHFIAHNHRIFEELNKYIGHDIILYENSLVYKVKGTDNKVPWHQDFMNRPDEIKKYVVWVALTDVTVENGAMKVIPGSHKGGFRKYLTVKGEGHHTRLDLEGVEPDDFAQVEMSAGDVLIFDQLLIHGSDHIPDASPRFAYRFSCQSMNQVFVPRGVPIVLSGGNPSRYLECTSRHISLRKRIMKKIGLHK